MTKNFFAQVTALLCVVLFSVSPLLSAAATTNSAGYQITAEDDGKGEDPNTEDPDEIVDDEVDEEGDVDEGSDDSDEKGAIPDDEDADDEKDGDDKSDIFGDWESPYEPPAELTDAYITAHDEGTCWDVMNAKFDLFAIETRYWRARVAPGTDGAETLDVILGSLKKMQIVMGENRTALEKRAGTRETCEENDAVSYIQEPLEDLKMDMRLAGYQVDTGDSRELEDDDVDGRCEKAEEQLDELAEKMSELQEELIKAAEEGDMEKVSNTKELLNQIKMNFGNSGALLKNVDSEKDLYEKMEACSGALDEADIGSELSTRADKFHEGKKDDDSSDVEQLDAKIKMFLDVIADKRVEALHYSNKEEILTALAQAEQAVVDVQAAFADIKYEKDPDLSAFDAQLDEIKNYIKSVIDVMLEGTEQEWTDNQREQSAIKLVSTARKNINKLNKQLNKKEKKADTESEEDIITYVDQSLADDAANAKKAAKAFQTAENFEQAQLQAYAAIMSARTAKSLLAEIQ